MCRFFLVLAGLISRLSGLVSRRSRKSNLTHFASRYSPSIGRMFADARTSTCSPIESSAQLTLFPPGHRASRPVLPGSDEAAEMTDGSGRKLLASVRACYRPGSWQRILLESLVSRTAWRSRNGLIVWRWRDTNGCRLSYIQLQHSEPTTGDIECSLLPTLTASTATLADMEQARFSGNDPRRPSYQEAKLLPTLIARDGRTYKGSQMPPGHVGAEPLIRVAGGTLDPVFCEWYMGFEDGWTDVE